MIHRHQGNRRRRVAGREEGLAEIATWQQRSNAAPQRRPGTFSALDRRILEQVAVLERLDKARRSGGLMA